MDPVTAQRQTIVSKPGKSSFTAFLARPITLAVLLVAATILLYYPVHSHGFVNYDDPEYVVDNAHVNSGLSLEMVRWALTTSAASNWHPLTWVSHGLDCSLFGLDPGGHHMVNVLFHALNAALLFWVLLSATGYVGRSFMVAALFALHPVNVESVAWIAERKTVLSTLFFFLALGAYTAYARRPRITIYVAVALLFALGLMAKPQIIVLPFVLLLWDYWPLRRTTLNDPGAAAGVAAWPTLPRKTAFALILEKIPLFLMAAASAVITLHVQHLARHGYPRLLRVGNGIQSYVLYIRNALWPSRLALLYPHPVTALLWREVFASAIVLLVITALVLLGGRHGYLPMGWFWFLGALIPMLGIVQVGIQAMADRYAYISFIGLFIMICWGVADLAERTRTPTFLVPVMSLVVLLALGATARRQINYWRTPVTIWQHTVEVTNNNWVGEKLWGGALSLAGRPQEAVLHYEKAFQHDRNDPQINAALGVNDLHQGKYADAIQHFKIAVKDRDEKPAARRQTYVAMAKAYDELGDKEGAREALQAARTLPAE
jgi:Flp pilus assembly protein TadD